MYLVAHVDSRSRLYIMPRSGLHSRSQTCLIEGILELGAAEEYGSGHSPSDFFSKYPYSIGMLGGVLSRIS